MTTILTRWLHPAGVPAQRRVAARLRVDGLEDRMTPAGVVTVAFSGAALTLTGDAAGNVFTVTQGVDGVLDLTPDAGTAFKLGPTTLPMGQAITLLKPVTGGVTANLGGGNDSLTFNGNSADIDLPAFLTVNGGDGDNTLRFQNGVTVGGNLTVSNLTGLDTTELFGSVTVLGKATVTNGNGGSVVAGDATTDLTVGGVFTVGNGTGADILDLDAAVRVTLGGLVFKGGVDAAANSVEVTPADELTILGNVSVTNSAGGDTVDIGSGADDVRLTGTVTVLNGAGTNQTFISSEERLVIGGQVTVGGGIDNDTLRIGLGATDAYLRGVTFTGSNGTNVFRIEPGTLVVNGNLTSTGGTGLDALAVSPGLGGGTVTGAVKATLGAGIASLSMPGAGGGLLIGKTLTVVSSNAAADANTFDLSNLKVTLGTSITSGLGADTFTIDDASFNGTVFLNAGGGNDVINIEQVDNAAGVVRFNKAVTILAGAGDDTVKVSAAAVEADRKVLFASTSKFDGGLGLDTLQIVAGNTFFGPARTVVNVEAEI